MPNSPDIPQFDDENEDMEIVPGFTPDAPEEPIPLVDEPIVQGKPMRPWRVPDLDGGYVSPQEILGPFDAYLAEVVQTNYASGDGLFGDEQRITAVRCEVWYQGNNEPVAVDIPQILSQPTPVYVEAMPFPLRHDMEKYHVVEGDIVTILEGRDGRNWYLCDEDSFVGVVIDNTEEGDGSELMEDFCGGAGNKSLCVRRRVLSGDPDGANWLGATVSVDLLDAADAEVEYAGVQPIRPTGMAHGYRVGDLVWVFRRGRYLFCQPGRQGFLAEVVATGPNSEAEPTDNSYYVKEQDWTIAYTNEKADYTYTQADRTAAVAGQSGSNGRWVMAYNLNENGHDLPTDGSLTVWVNMIADPATGEVGYVFNYDAQRIYWGKATTLCTDDIVGWEVAVVPCDDILGTNPAAPPAVKVYFDALRGSHQAPNVRIDQVVGFVYVQGLRYCVKGQRWDELIGAVKIWHSTTIPDGWSLCDGVGRLGMEETPADLTGKFIRGWYSGHEDEDTFGETGGSDSIDIDAHASHTHTLPAGSGQTAGEDISCVTGGPSAELAHASADNRPAFFTVLFIQRMD